MENALLVQVSAILYRSASKYHIFVAILGVIGLVFNSHGAIAQEDLELSGPAYRIATQAYQAYEKHDYQQAIVQAREAIRQRPDVGRLRILLVNALAASGDFKQARQEASLSANDPFLTSTDQDKLRKLLTTIHASSTPQTQGTAYRAASVAYRAYAQNNYPLAITKAREATKLMPSNKRYKQLLNNALAARQLGIYAQRNGMLSSNGLLASKAANAAYNAIKNHHDAEALYNARQAVHLAPDIRAFRLLLIDVLVRNNMKTEALAETKKAVRDLGQNTELLQQQGFLEASLGDQPAAYKSLKVATQLTPWADHARTLYLVFADAALATKHPEDAFAALEPFGADADYDVWTRRGHALFDMKNYNGAESAYCKAEYLAHTPEELNEVLAARIAVIKAQGHTAEALHFFTSKLTDGTLSSQGPANLAYLAAEAGDKRTAYQAFNAAFRRGELSGEKWIDAAYTARHVYRNPEAVLFFKKAIDAEKLGQYHLSPISLYGLRREVAEITRVWGAYATLNYGSSGISNASYLPPNTLGRTTQLGAEVYWRPPVIGYRDGAIVEVFLRSYMTLSNTTYWATGPSSLQGNIGVRWKPLKRYNFVIEASKLFKIGQYSRDDMLLRAAISDGFGGSDLHVDVPSWWSGQYYAEGGRYMQYGENIADGELRFGRSYRVNQISDHLVMTPFVGLAANYDSYFGNPFALGTGPGLNTRFWFREDTYAALRSYVDLTVQYRFHLVGDNRARGIFVGLSAAY